MMRIILENDDHDVVVVETTNLDHNEAVAPDGTIFTLFGPPTNLSGEQWDEEEGPTWWRRVK